MAEVGVKINKYINNFVQLLIRTSLTMAKHKLMSWVFAIYLVSKNVDEKCKQINLGLNVALGESHNV